MMNDDMETKSMTEAFENATSVWKVWKANNQEAWGPSHVDAETSSEGPDLEWDCGLLVRQLVAEESTKESAPASPQDERGGDGMWKATSTDYDADLAHVPAGVYDRRHISRLVEELLADNTIPWPQTR
ncbi:hypothetical protein CSOJ01_07090 [Colletotrichum sojae]|uniref:Uncharacterized protein n=1 Tax=Colletotrichum sojae TaxID=2175907 RepID=A0A8H6MUT5_9PEZI|nr:hypothetical protein CSOJ01_07090 [Colletotrichum sojae]